MQRLIKTIQKKREKSEQMLILLRRKRDDLLALGPSALNDLLNYPEKIRGCHHNMNIAQNEREELEQMLLLLTRKRDAVLALGPSVLNDLFNDPEKIRGCDRIELVRMQVKLETFASYFSFLSEVCNF